MMLEKLAGFPHVQNIKKHSKKNTNSQRQLNLPSVENSP